MSRWILLADNFYPRTVYYMRKESSGYALTEYPYLNSSKWNSKRGL